MRQRPPGAQRLPSLSAWWRGALTSRSCWPTQSRSTGWRSACPPWEASWARWRCYCARRCCPACARWTTSWLSGCRGRWPSWRRRWRARPGTCATSPCSRPPEARSPPPPSRLPRRRWRARRGWRACGAMCWRRSPSWTWTRRCPCSSRCPPRRRLPPRCRRPRATPSPRGASCRSSWTGSPTGRRCTPSASACWRRSCTTWRRCSCTRRTSGARCSWPAWARRSAGRAPSPPPPGA
mmetsp:Transcript_883/g.2297  ORF Transcript_883/g.2297 Transcript_883/m.2297 type:complete len:237 (-) Transcript_883:410-1120(-)